MCSFNYFLLITFFSFSFQFNHFSGYGAVEGKEKKPKIAIKIEKSSRRSGTQIFVGGYRFVIASQSDSTVYLKCANFRNKCKARASKRKDTGETYITKCQHHPDCVVLLSEDVEFAAC